MIKSIYIKNFKAFEKETIPIEDHNIIIGENDSGKSTILQALDIFFNQDKINEKSFVRIQNEPVEIGIFINDTFYKKVYKGSTYKLDEEESTNTDNISNLKYIYIPVTEYNPAKLISDLSIAKSLENTNSNLIEQLKEISQSSIDEVIQGIDPQMIVINNEITEISGFEGFKYDAALKFTVKSNGIPIEARGSGFQKNLMYSLLIGNNYENVIVGIDEIENSFSINNCEEMLRKLQSSLGQTIITTHSKKIMEVAGTSNIIPLYTNSYTTTPELLAALDRTNEKKYLLVEGPFDIPWYKKILDLLGVINDYIIIPSGGSDNINHIKTELENIGKDCLVVKDGDCNDQNNSISKECVELYTPLENINSILNVNLTTIPTTKEEFFNQTITENRNKDSVKRLLSLKCNEFLTIDNDLVAEIEEILNR